MKLLQMQRSLRAIHRRASPAALLGFAAFLAACSGSGKPDVQPEPNILPTDYRSAIIAAIRQSDDDPVGIRDAGIAPPALKPSGTETRYVVCFRYNAKTNGGGPYTGIKERAAIFFGGELTAIPAATREQCGGAPYQPWPELEKLCREIVCPGAR